MIEINPILITVFALILCIVALVVFYYYREQISRGAKEKFLTKRRPPWWVIVGVIISAILMNGPFINIVKTLGVFLLVIMMGVIMSYNASK